MGWVMSWWVRGGGEYISENDDNDDIDENNDDKWKKE